MDTDDEQPAEYEAPDAVEFIRSLVGAWDCCATCAGGVLAKRDRERDAVRDASTPPASPRRSPLYPGRKSGHVVRDDNSPCWCGDQHFYAEEADDA